MSNEEATYPDGFLVSFDQVAWSYICESTKGY